MLILRDRIFTRRDKLNNSDYLDNELNDLGLSVSIDLQRTKKFNQQYINQSPSNKDIIKNLIKDIKLGYYYEDGPNNGDTHWLKDFSHKDSHLMSKHINYSDRLNYRIYRPTIELDENGQPLQKQTLKIVLEYCEGHNRNGVEKHYSN
jgi:hypothetical protein